MTFSNRKKGETANAFKNRLVNYLRNANTRPENRKAVLKKYVNLPKNNNAVDPITFANGTNVILGDIFVNKKGDLVAKHLWNRNSLRTWTRTKANNINTTNVPHPITRRNLVNDMVVSRTNGNLAPVTRNTNKQRVLNRRALYYGNTNNNNNNNNNNIPNADIPEGWYRRILREGGADTMSAWGRDKVWFAIGRPGSRQQQWAVDQDRYVLTNAQISELTDIIARAFRRARDIARTRRDFAPVVNAAKLAKKLANRVREARRDGINTRQSRQAAHDLGWAIDDIGASILEEDDDEIVRLSNELGLRGWAHRLGLQHLGSQYI